MEQINQGSEAWFQARLGKATGSRIADIIAKTKTGYATSRENYMAQLVCERMTQKVAESYSNSAMAWGTETEPLARAAYEVKTGLTVDQVGFVDHPTIAMTGASPDGLVGESGMIEIKCPNTATHIDTLLSSKVPTKYLTQMTWQMCCTGRHWTDFVSYDPRLPENLQLFIKRVEYDPKYASELEQEVIRFLDEVDGKIKQLEKLNG
jgi:putative phage-type endonuclease